VAIFMRTVGSNSFFYLSVIKIAVENLLAKKSRSITISMGIALGLALIGNFFIIIEIQKYISISEEIIFIKEYQIWLAIISLFISLIGITNSFLLFISERFSEIGLLKASGCSDFQLYIIFISESCLLGIVGGLTGTILGAGTSITLAILETKNQFIIEVLLTNNITILAVVVFQTIILGVIISLLAASLSIYKGLTLNIIEALEFTI
jgi:putative ABC transport system permease protein